MTAGRIGAVDALSFRAQASKSLQDYGLSFGSVVSVALLF